MTGRFSEKGCEHLQQDTGRQGLQLALGGQRAAGQPVKIPSKATHNMSSKMLQPWSVTGPEDGLTAASCPGVLLELIQRSNPLMSVHTLYRR